MRPIEPIISDAPVVIGANWYRFAPAESITHPHVMSASYVWPVSGRGNIRAAGREFRMEPGAILRLPWGHRVEYSPDRDAPFHLGTLHLVPHHDRAVAVEPHVPHRPNDPMLNAPFRRGAPGFGLALGSTRSGVGARIAALASVAVERFRTVPFDEAVFRALAEVICLENRTWADAPEVLQSIPLALDRMATFVRANLAIPATVAEIAAAGECSVSTAERLFARHFGTTVRAWCGEVRLEEAARLLRSSNLRVAEVARTVGFVDPLYFSRVFRRRFGMAPRDYARGELRP